MFNAFRLTLVLFVLLHVPVFHSSALAQSPVTSVISSQAGEQVVKVQVVRVLDGDTVDVVDSSGARHRVRLAEIDAPESKQDYGSQSTRALSARIGGKHIELHFSQRDRYDRIIGHLFLNGENVNYWMVQQGHAWQYKRYSHSKTLSDMQNHAQGKKIGLWAKQGAMAPWEFRRNR